jgi:hypothetical protein
LILALICFGYNIKSCEIFNGTSAVLSPFSTNWTHVYGGLGLYSGQPTTVGCSNEEHNKTETLSPSGWTALSDHPL